MGNQDNQNFKTGLHFPEKKKKGSIWKTPSQSRCLKQEWVQYQERCMTPEYFKPDTHLLVLSIRNLDSVFFIPQLKLRTGMKITWIHSQTSITSTSKSVLTCSNRFTQKMTSMKSIILWCLMQCWEEDLDRRTTSMLKVFTRITDLAIKSIVNLWMPMVVNTWQSLLTKIGLRMLSKVWKVSFSGDLSWIKNLWNTCLLQFWTEILSKCKTLVPLLTLDSLTVE